MTFAFITDGAEVKVNTLSAVIPDLQGVALVAGVAGVGESVIAELYHAMGMTW